MEQSKFDADLAIKGETTARSAFNLGELETLARIDKEKGNDLTANDVFRVVKEHEEDYRKVLSEVNLETGNVEFRDAGNYMEVPIEIIREVSRLIEIK